jgi:hypothetical protein
VQATTIEMDEQRAEGGWAEAFTRPRLLRRKGEQLPFPVQCAARCSCRRTGGKPAFGSLSCAICITNELRGDAMLPS